MIMTVWVAAQILSSNIKYLKASFKVLKDYIHVVKFYMLDGLPKPPCEVPYRLFYVFQNSL